MVISSPGRGWVHKVKFCSSKLSPFLFFPLQYSSLLSNFLHFRCSSKRIARLDRFVVRSLHYKPLSIQVFLNSLLGLLPLSHIYLLLGRIQSFFLELIDLFALNCLIDVFHRRLLAVPLCQMSTYKTILIYWRSLFDGDVNLTESSF
jgi:hypothetical protein